MDKSHRYTNLKDFDFKVKSRIKIDDDDFEVINSELEENDKIVEDNVEYLQEEDEIIQALNICMIKSVGKLIPKKDSSEMVDQLGENLMKKNGDKAKFVCSKHPEKNANFICVNKSCEYILYCMSCRKQHSKECTRKEMYLNVKDIEDKNFVDQYFDSSDFGYNEKIESVKKMIADHKDRMNNSYDLLEKNLIGKIKFHSKEFIMKRIKDSIEEKFNEYNGKHHLYCF
jgi:hypothetical protein